MEAVAAHITAFAGAGPSQPRLGPGIVTVPAIGLPIWPQSPKAE
jgi:hypothetical protein